MSHEPRDPRPHRPPPLPTPVEPLAYANDQPLHRLPFGGRFAVGFFGYLLLSAAWAGAAYWGKVPVRLALYGWFGLTLAALSSAVYVRVRYQYSGVGYGIIAAMLSATILIVVGVFLLILSICSGWIQ